MTMDMGIFLPNLSNGWLITTEAPPFESNYDNVLRVVQKSEEWGLEFALAPVKLRGFGGPSEFWDHAPEPITMMAGVAAQTSKIRLFASVATLTIPPAIAARMAATLDQISNGRFGLNIVSGWQPAEYEQMSLWPGDSYFAERYAYCAEYVTILRQLWETGQSDFKGRWFTMKDCHLSPRPKGHIDVVCAGQSEKGLAFCSEFGDYMFSQGVGINTPTAHAANTARLLAEGKRTGRTIGAYLAMMIIAEKTDEAAFAKWHRYNAGTDRVALANLSGEAGADASASASSTAKSLVKGEVDASGLKPLPEGAVNMHFGTLVGSYENVARMLDETSMVPGTAGVMMIFDDWIRGVENFGRYVQPLMKSRSAIRKAS
jgi:pyrimidine oxygenase